MMLIMLLMPLLLAPRDLIRWFSPPTLMRCPRYGAPYLPPSRFRRHAAFSFAMRHFAPLLPP